jgi:hypothetical protein
MASHSLTPRRVDAYTVEITEISIISPRIDMR